MYKLITTAAAAVVAVRSQLIQGAPEQVHLALAGDSGARVMWFTMDESLEASCNYGTAPDALDKSSKGQYDEFAN